MRYLISIILVVVLSSCIARSSYVDDLAKKVANLAGVVNANSKAIYILSPTPENLATVINAGAVHAQLIELANESSSVDVGEIIAPVMSIATMITGGAGGTAVIMGIADMFLQRRKNKKLNLAARKAANEPDPIVAHKLIDEAKA